MSIFFIQPILFFFSNMGYKMDKKQILIYYIEDKRGSVHIQATMYNHFSQ